MVEMFPGTEDIVWGLWSSHDNEWQVLLNRLWCDNKADNISSSTESKIPAIIHQLWLGNSPIPHTCLQWMNNWIAMNPEFEYKLWRDSDIAMLTLKNNELLKRCTNPGHKSDILRLEILRQFGGFYIDVDFECLRPIDELRRNYGFLIGFSNVGYFELNNGFMATCAGHPLIEFLVSKISQPWVKWGGHFVDSKYRMMSAIADLDGLQILGSPLECTPHFIESTGPGFVTRAIMCWLQTQMENENTHNSILNSSQYRVIVLPSKYLYPIANIFRGKITASMRRQAIKENSFGIHYWMKTWDNLN